MRLSVTEQLRKLQATSRKKSCVSLRDSMSAMLFVVSTVSFRLADNKQNVNLRLTLRNNFPIDGHSWTDTESQ